MNKVDSFIKKNALKSKIENHFKKNPKSKTLLVTSNVGGNKVLWKVKKEGKSYKVTEVNSFKKEYILEAPLGNPAGLASPGLPQPNPPGQPAKLGMSPGQRSAQQQNLAAFEAQDFSSKVSMLQSGVVPLNEHSLSAIFLDLMRPDALRNVVQLRKVLESLSSRVTPESKGLVGSFMGVLTTLSNNKKVVNADNRKPGKVVREASVSSDEDNQEKEPVKLAPKLPKQDPNPPQDDEVDDEVGIENEPDVDPMQALPPERQKSEEEFALQKNLSGQTIRNANVNLNANGGTLNLDLVNTKIPAQIKWDNNGKVTFSFKDRPYVIRRGE